jgi:type IV secretion system protein VirD4
MAGYGLKAFLIAQSLNQIEKAYGQNNAILDNCHVRVCFATNDERTAKRISDSLGTATELRTMKNYAGHRLAPWLGHLMVSRTDTARPLLTPGEIMQLPDDEEIIMLAGVHPVRAKKVKYYRDKRLSERVLPPPNTEAAQVNTPHRNDWPRPAPVRAPAHAQETITMAPPQTPPAIMEDDGGHQLILPLDQPVEPKVQAPPDEFDYSDRAEPPVRQAAARQHQIELKAQTARQVTLDPTDGIPL